MQRWGQCPAMHCQNACRNVSCVNHHRRCFAWRACHAELFSSHAFATQSRSQACIYRHNQGRFVTSVRALSAPRTLSRDSSTKPVYACCAQGADPDTQDTNGNTTAHMMVIYDKMVSCCSAPSTARRIDDPVNMKESDPTSRVESFG